MDEERAAREARFDDEVGRRIQDWAIEQYGDELEAGFLEFAGEAGEIGEGEVDLLALWFHNHRPIRSGGTPAERYAARPDLDDAERAAVVRIATARLGLFRVVSHAGPLADARGTRWRRAFRGPEPGNLAPRGPSIEQLEDELAVYAAHLSAGTCRWLAVVAELDRRIGYTAWRSCAEWIAYRCALTPRAAREHVRVARALLALPTIREAFARAEISYVKAAAARPG